MNDISSRSLVFIVGAGASKDFGESMPVGTDLALAIETQLSNEFSAGAQDGPIKTALMRSDRGLSADDERAAIQISTSIFAQPSIDDLLNEWRENPAMIRVGKIAIANSILEAERLSSLGITASNSIDHTRTAISGLRNSWLAFLLKNLRRGIPRRDIEAVFGEVAFIVFNYDRCIEQYLYWAFQNVAGVNPGNAALAVDRVPIVHVYGDLGRLPYHGVNSSGIGFGSQQAIHKRIFERIKTYTEEDHDKANLAKIHSLVENARRIVFLGFGYHQRNLDLLLGAGKPRKDCEIWGTSISPDQTRLQAVQQGFNAGAKPARLEHFGCTEFLSMNRDAILGETS